MLRNAIGRGMCQISRKNCYVTLEWPPKNILLRNDLQVKQANNAHICMNYHTHIYILYGLSLPRCMNCAIVVPYVYMSVSMHGHWIVLALKYV